MDKELLHFAQLAVAVGRPHRAASAVPPTRPPPCSPHSCGASGRLRLTNRGLEGLLRIFGELRRVCGLRVVPDHSTLWWFARRHVGSGLLDAALGETVR